MYRELKDSDKEKESGKMVSLSMFSLYVYDWMSDVSSLTSDLFPFTGVL